MKKQLLMMLCLIGMAASVQAQTISGKLVDEQNQPLAYANVVLLSLPDSTFVSGTTTDEMGDFRLTPNERGKLIRISSVGYLTLYKEVKTNMGTIPMKPDAQLLGEVVVKGNLPITRAKGDAMVTTVTSHSRKENTLYAAKLILSHPWAGGQFSFGSEYTYAQRINGYENMEGILNDDDSEITDNGISVFADASYQTKGQAANVDRLIDCWYMNLSLYKSFNHDRMSLQFQMSNLFNTRKEHFVMYSGLRTMEMEEEMRRTVSLTFRYKFNPTKSKYKGTGAGQSQKARM